MELIRSIERSRAIENKIEATLGNCGRKETQQEQLLTASYRGSTGPAAQTVQQDNKKPSERSRIPHHLVGEDSESV